MTFGGMSMTSDTVQKDQNRDRKTWVEALVAELVVDYGSGFRDLFGEIGARPPFFLWSPKASDVYNPDLLKFFEICQGQLDKTGRLRQRNLNLDAFSSMLDRVIVIDVEEDASVFRYAHYGSAIAQRYRRNMQGRTTADFGGNISVFFEAAYRAICTRKAWLLSEHEPPSQVFVQRWKRLMVPIFDDKDEVLQIILVNIPENSLQAGLDLVADPVFVLSADKHVQYANGMAQEVFSLEPLGPEDVTLKDLTGIDIRLYRTPQELLGRKQVLNFDQKGPTGQLLEQFTLTVSGALYRNSPIYVVILRMIDQFPRPI